MIGSTISNLSPFSVIGPLVGEPGSFQYSSIVTPFPPLGKRQLEEEVREVEAYEW